MSRDDEKAGLAAGGMVIAAVAVAGAVMAVIRRATGRKPEVRRASQPWQPEDDAVEYYD